MKFWIGCIVIFTALFVQGSTNSNSGPANGGYERKILERSVSDVDINEVNLLLALSRFADKYNVPIGIEVSPLDRLQYGKPVVFKLKDGTVGDVLNSLVPEKSLYAWEIKDGVINVSPKFENRDPLLAEMLETKIEAFSIKKGDARLTIRQRITDSPELKRLLRDRGLIAEHEAFTSYDIAALGRTYQCNASNETLRSILNKIIRESESKSWVINRYGEGRRYLLVNL